MKKRLSLLMIVVLVGCLTMCKEKENGKAYSTEAAVMNLSTTMKYYHIIFQEAESAWRRLDAEQYNPEGGSIIDYEGGTKYMRTITYEKSSSQYITVMFTNWLENHIHFTGGLRITVPDGGYGKQGKSMQIDFIDEFTMNGFRPQGRLSVICMGANENGVGTAYSCSVVDGTFTEPENKEVLASCNMTSAQYNRVSGDATLDYKDDVWSFNGSIKGNLFDDVKFAYTANLQSLIYEPNCQTASTGLASIEVKEQAPIQCTFQCDNVDFYVLKEE